MPISCDNQGALKLITTGVLKAKTKHKDIKFHHARDDEAIDLEDKLIVEQLTGWLPMFLRALLAIDLKEPARLPMGGDDEEEAQTTSGITVVEEYAEKAAKFMARFWTSDEVQQVCYRIHRFCLGFQMKRFDTPIWTIHLSRKSRTFNGSQPVVDPRDGFTFYVPLTINYKAVDAVMVFLDSTQKEGDGGWSSNNDLLKLSATEEAFLKVGAWSRQIFHGQTVVFRFLWLMEDRDKRKPMEVVPGKKRTLAKREIIACPEFERRHISIKDFNKEIADKL
ncbi:hypothetical protein FN846DRAFT_918945 [Sphaerosporella brunnea]|uniref:Uncharacterized protein n=1 Tax=Sphaerosporella brunnea TaxID=1250544 RepID=A0A5J5EXL3_9PEZI|nr:hypothetical protein FN846DRAFT_918945 [Sphaerosporella brunnea]